MKTYNKPFIVPTDPSTLKDLYSDTWVAVDDVGRYVAYAAAFVAELNCYTSGTGVILSPKSEAPEGESGRQLFEVLDRSF